MSKCVKKFFQSCAWYKDPVCTPILITQTTPSTATPTPDTTSTMASYIPFEKTPRVITLKRKLEPTYTAQIWPIDDDQVLKGRVIILRNPGEDINMYRRTIDVLASSGYESFYYTGYMEKFEEEQLITKEINRIVRMCVDDMDEIVGPDKTRVHILGSHFTGAQALMYGITGSYRYRLKTIMAINPLVEPTSVFAGKALGVGLNLKVRMKPKGWSNLKMAPEMYTADPEWLEYLKQKNAARSESWYSNMQLKHFQTLTADLTNKTKSRKFDMKHVLVICSNEDPLAKASSTQLFVNNTGAESAYYMEYDHGMSNLFIERERIFQKLITDITMWLDENA